MRTNEPAVKFAALRIVAAQAYASPGRAYHDATHLEEVLACYDVVARDAGWNQPSEVYVALLFHDAVYVPGSRDNEERSAELAAVEIRRAGLDVDVARVMQLIRLTAKHGRHESNVDRDAALFLDCDMAILGADADRYDAYERGIRREYAAVPEEIFEEGRTRFVSSVLAGRIYLSEYFFTRLEARARENLLRALAA